MDLKSSILREVSSRTRAPKAVLFRLASFLLEALIIGKTLWNQKLPLEAIEYITITIFEIRRPRPIK
jgi:DNA polymerase III gamma/tau subunit